MLWDPLGRHRSGPGCTRGRGPGGSVSAAIETPTRGGPGERSSLWQGQIQRRGSTLDHRRRRANWIEYGPVFTEELGAGSAARDAVGRAGTRCATARQRRLKHVGRGSGGRPAHLSPGGFLGPSVEKTRRTFGDRMFPQNLPRRAGLGRDRPRISRSSIPPGGLRSGRAGSAPNRAARAGPGPRLQHRSRPSILPRFADRMTPAAIIRCNTPRGGDRGSCRFLFFDFCGSNSSATGCDAGLFPEWDGGSRRRLIVGGRGEKKRVRRVEGRAPASTDEVLITDRVVGKCLRKNSTRASCHSAARGRLGISRAVARGISVYKPYRPFPRRQPRRLQGDFLGA